MLELQKKIQELEISMQEAKAKQAVPPSGIKSQQVVIDKSVSAAIFHWSKKPNFVCS
jgi:hypothetical protein